MSFKLKKYRTNRFFSLKFTLYWIKQFSNLETIKPTPTYHNRPVKAGFHSIFFVCQLKFWGHILSMRVYTNLLDQICYKNGYYAKTPLGCIFSLIFTNFREFPRIFAKFKGVKFKLDSHLGL